MLSYGEITTLQFKLLSTKVTNQQKAKSQSCNILQKHGVLTSAEAHKLKVEKAAKKEAIEKKCKIYIERVAKNKIKNELKAHGVIARRQEKERKKKVQELEKAHCFVPLELLEAIPDPEKTTTNADIKLQLQETLISTQGYSMREYLPDNPSDTPTTDPDSTLDADFISFEGLDNTNESSVWETPSTISRQAWNQESWNQESIDTDDIVDTSLF